MWCLLLIEIWERFARLERDLGEICKTWDTKERKNKEWFGKGRNEKDLREEEEISEMVRIEGGDFYL